MWPGGAHMYEAGGVPCPLIGAAGRLLGGPPPRLQVRAGAQQVPREQLQARVQPREALPAVHGSSHVLHRTHTTAAVNRTHNGTAIKALGPHKARQQQRRARPALRDAQDPKASLGRQPPA
jgi:hypothetical protein